MPTVFGAWFGVLLGLMAIGGLNFNNNMTLLLVFLLGSIAMLTTLLAYRNLVGITVNGIIANPVFAGERAEFRVFLKNPEERHRFAIAVTGPDCRDCTTSNPETRATCASSRTPRRRGWLGMAPFRIENRFPLGLFRAWSVVIPDGTLPGLSETDVQSAAASHVRPRRPGRGQQGRRRTLSRSARLSGRRSTAPDRLAQQRPSSKVVLAAKWKHRAMRPVS